MGVQLGGPYFNPADVVGKDLAHTLQLHLGYALHRMFRSQCQLTIPNVYVPEWYEADLLMVTTRDTLWEFEIKVSLSDFRNDANKRNKHDNLTKYQRLRRGPSHHPLTRMFYVAPPGVIPINELPPFAGLIEMEYVEVELEGYLRSRYLKEQQKETSAKDLLDALDRKPDRSSENPARRKMRYKEETTNEPITIKRWEIHVVKAGPYLRKGAAQAIPMECLWKVYRSCAYRLSTALITGQLARDMRFPNVPVDDFNTRAFLDDRDIHTVRYYSPIDDDPDE